MQRALIFCLFSLLACTQATQDSKVEHASTFAEVGEVNVEGGELAAEISAYDPKTEKLFVSNNALGNRVDVIDLSDVNRPLAIDHILLKKLVDEKLTINSLSVGGELLAVAASAGNPQDPGKSYD